jgi:membrane protease YdiL (CAAX protease family)
MAVVFGIIIPKLHGNGYAIAGVVFYFLLILLIVLIVKGYEKRELRSIGLHTHNLEKQILIGIGIFLVFSLLTIIPLLLGFNKHDVLNYKPKNIALLIYAILYDICLVGFGEELIFRGYFLERIRDIFHSNLWGVLLSSILFGLYHYPMNHNIEQVIMATVVGIIYSVCKLKIKNCGLISLTIAHGCNDAFIIFLGYFLL